MNARSISFSVFGAIWLAVVMMAEPTAHGAGDQDRVAALEARIELLEKERKTEDRELKSLQSRVSQLERVARQGKSTTALGPQSNEVSQLKRDSADLKRAVRNVESKASINGQSATQLQREIDRLRLKVATLENTVERLKR